jgi:alkylated DNA repair dioxygenase AlkB
MGWHADDEPELGPEPLIASLNLGATRRFRIRPRGGGPSVGVDLESGSLLLMSGRSQADYQHAVPKTRRPVGLRINLTFRNILRHR